MLLGWRMPWNAQFWKPIKLSDGRKIATLHDARALIELLPSPRQANPHWRDADDKLTRAAASKSAEDDALLAMLSALKVEGMI
jgi:hypothetical protein